MVTTFTEEQVRSRQPYCSQCGDPIGQSPACGPTHRTMELELAVSRQPLGEELAGIYGNPGQTHYVGDDCPGGHAAEPPRPLYLCGFCSYSIDGRCIHYWYERAHIAKTEGRREALIEAHTGAEKTATYQAGKDQGRREALAEAQADMKLVVTVHRQEIQAARLDAARKVRDALLGEELQIEGSLEHKRRVFGDEVLRRIIGDAE